MTKYQTGHIHSIISYLKETHGVSSIRQLPAITKLNTLCEALQLTPAQLDGLIIDYPQVQRTVTGHAFEIVFEQLVSMNGAEYLPEGGDTNIDGQINGKTLQLKTPYKAGTQKNMVSYKSHKTHGPKSEAESMEYYALKSDFPDLLVGLVSYSPLRILFLEREELPPHPADSARILSPFSIIWDSHPGLNAFQMVGLNNVDVESLLKFILPDPDKELLPRSSKNLRLKTEIILDTILRESNFRIWDMNIRGFAREVAFGNMLESRSILQYKPVEVRPECGDKADIVLRQAVSEEFVFFQMKGVSINYCSFEGDASTVGVETQLTRGRVNDHPTQSRLYLATDFDYLILALDPSVAASYNQAVSRSAVLEWEFYIIPTDHLEMHNKYPQRIKPVQKFNYLDLQEYRLSSSWENEWEKHKPRS